jgi:hypothetical protein
MIYNKLETHFLKCLLLEPFLEKSIIRKEIKLKKKKQYIIKKYKYTHTHILTNLP